MEAICLTQFFGDKSLFDIIVAIFAIGTGVYTLYKSLLEQAKLSLFPGDTVGLVSASNG